MKLKTFFIIRWWQNTYPKQWIWWISSWLLELIIKKTVILITLQNRFFLKLEKWYFTFFSSQLWKYYIKFWSNQDNFLNVLLFSLYKKVHSEYSPDNYKSLKISIGTIVEYPEMLRFVLDHLKTKNICKNCHPK